MTTRNGTKNPPRFRKGVSADILVSCEGSPGTTGFGSVADGSLVNIMAPILHSPAVVCASDVRDHSNAVCVV